MTDQITLHLDNAQKTADFGRSLAETLYATPLDITWSGPVGAGKSTAIRAFFAALGVTERVPSPTFALQQQFESTSGIPLLHIDLYRMNERDAREFLQQSDHHAGIRCIEWAERSSSTPPLPHLAVTMEEEGEGRLAHVRFEDADIPSDEDIAFWRDEVALSTLVRQHCDAVARASLVCADDLLQRGIAVRRKALYAAAMLHDLVRFVDFKPELWERETPQTQATWKAWKERYNCRHEEACARLLQERGYPTVATIVETHGLRLPSPERRTIEQQILYYADKRVAFDRVVTLDERFADFHNRYGPGREAEGRIWLEEAKDVERRLFPNGLPGLTGRPA